MKKVKILNEQSKPTTPTQASEQGWKLSKEKAKTAGGCNDSGLEQIVINNRSYYKCKEGSQPNTVDNNTQTPPPPAPTQPVVTEPAKDSLKYFNDFTFYDQDEKEIKFSDDEKKEVMTLLPKFKNIGGKKYDDDDAFVRAAIFFKQDKKNVMIYYVDFLTTPDIQLVPDNYKRIGLGLSVLLEQSFKSRMYVKNIGNGNFALTGERQPKTGSGKVERIASQPTQTGSTQNATQTRPEQSMGVAPKPEVIVKVAETQGTVPVMKTLNDEQKRVVQRYANEGYETSKPADADLSMYDTIDLKSTESAFESFPTFVMYKIKRLTEDGLNSIASGLTTQDVTEELCKQNIKVYHDGAMDRKTMSDGARKAFAEFIIACRAQYRDGWGTKDAGFMNGKLVKSKTNVYLNDIESKFVSAEYCKYKINFAEKAVGCGANLLDIE
jgi:hypothetical protein